MPENPTRLVVSHPSESSESTSKGLLIFVVGLICVLVGGACDFFAHRYLENEKQYARYAAELAPLVYYNFERGKFLKFLAIVDVNILHLSSILRQL